MVGGGVGLQVSGRGPNGDFDDCLLEFDYSIRTKRPAQLIPVVMDR